MIAIEKKGNLLEVGVCAELRLPDYRRLETAVSKELKSTPTVKLLVLQVGAVAVVGKRGVVARIMTLHDDTVFNAA